METLQIIFIIVCLAIWTCFSICLLINAVMTLVYDHKREKREKEQAARDLEYHNKRMESLK